MPVFIFSLFFVFVGFFDFLLKFSDLVMLTEKLVGVDVFLFIYLVKKIYTSKSTVISYEIIAEMVLLI